MQNYYAILGVTLDAEEVVIKAAYRALCKKYHPDVYDGDEDFATEQMKKINIAYDVLSNKEKKAEYDRSMDIGDQFKEMEPGQSFSPDHEELIEKDWDFAVKFYPGILKNYKNLKKLSADLAYSYKLVIVEYKLYDKHDETARDFENSYLEKHFGEDSRVKNLAKAYILESNPAAVDELKQAVHLFGTNINSKVVCENILKTHPLTDTGWNSDNSEDEADHQWKSNILGEIDLDEAGKLYENIRDGIVRWGWIAVVIVILVLIFIINPN